MRFKAKIKIVDLETSKLLPCSSAKIYEDGDGKVHVFKSEAGVLKLSGVFERDARAIIQSEGHVDKCIRLVDLGGLNQISLVKDGVVGYVYPRTNFASESVELCVHSNVGWECEVYRCSISQNRIYSSELQKPCLQEVPNIGVSGNGLKWRINFRLEGSLFSRSGLYAVRLKDTLGNCLCLPLVINEATPRNKLCVVANMSTWNMYNCWGGRSRYRNFELNKDTGQNRTTRFSRFKNAVKRRYLRYVKSVQSHNAGFHMEPDWITQPLAMERPLFNNALIHTSAYTPYLDHLAGHEWRFLSWLERERFSYDYMQDNCLASVGEQLSEYETIVLVGHSEYWSKKDYESLQTAYENGVNILNLSGNSLYQQVIYSEEHSVHAECRGLKKLDRTWELANYFYTDLSVKTFSNFVRIDKHVEYSGLPETFGEKTLLDLSLREKEKAYDASLPFQGALFRPGSVGASGWEVDKVSEKYIDYARLHAVGNNEGRGAEMFSIDAPNTGSFFCASSIAFIGALLVDEKLSAFTSRLLRDGCAGKVSD